MDRLGGYFGTHDEDEPFDDYVEEGDADLDPPPSPVGQDERRMQVRAYNHWASLLGDLNFPNIEDLEPEKLDDFGPYSVLLGLVDGIEDPDVLFVGSELEADCGETGVLGKLSDVPSRSVLSRITDHYMQILANQAAIGFEAEFANERGVTVLYRGILLPYSSDNQTIDYIYGVINWKELADRQTADELLLQIGQALGDYDDDPVDDNHGIETAETLTAIDEDGWDEPESEGDEEDEDEILDLAAISASAGDDAAEEIMPVPAFGGTEDAGDAAPRAGRGVDALGNPIGSLRDEYGAGEDDYDDYDGGMKTAADYGLPDWDDEDDLENEDVDDVVDPLADEEASSSLTSLVSRGERTKKAVDLSATEGASGIPQPFVPEPPTITISAPDPFELVAEPEDDEEDPQTGYLHDETGYPDAGKDKGIEEAYELAFDAIAPEEHAGDIFELEVVVEDAEALEAPAGDTDDDASEFVAVVPDVAPEGLYDCLAAARELAQAAQNTEDRSRKALYAAVGLAYDFSLESEADPEGFDELLADNGLTVQDRAPMTPVVKLVFGAEYDKTRLTEYAAVLMHAHRIGMERGALAGYLHAAEGGLKAVVNAERRARKEEQGKPVEDTGSVRSALAKKLRKLDPVALDAIADTGPEFALVMVRRTPDGELVLLGEVPEDIGLVERAARKLLG